MCLACHGQNGRSLIPETSIGGRPSLFVVAQLSLFRREARKNPVMTDAAKPLTDAHFFAHLPRP